MKSNIPAIDNRTARKKLNLISITFGFNTLAGSIVFPFLPIYLHSIRGIPMSTVGLIFPVMGLATIIGSPFSGYLADRFGRRIVMVIGPMLRSLSHFSLAVMAAVNAPLWVIAIGLFFAFFLGTFFQNAANAYVTDLIHPADRTVAFSKIRVGLNIGWMIGPAIGAFLARTPFFLLFLMTASFCLVTAFSVFRWCPELNSGQESRAHDRASNISFSQILKQDRFFLLFISLCFLLFLSVSQFVSTLSIYATEIVGISKTQLGLLYTLNGAIVITTLVYLNQKLQKNNIFLRTTVLPKRLIDSTSASKKQSYLLESTFLVFILIILFSHRSSSTRMTANINAIKTAIKKVSNFLRRRNRKNFFNCS